MKRSLILAAVLLMLLALAACGGGETAEAPAAPEATVEEAMAEGETAVGSDEMDAAPDAGAAAEMEEAADAPTATPLAAETAEMQEETAPQANLPAWQQIELTDVRSGETFTLADFAGQTVFVEPMATWCTNCRRQLINVQTARAQLNPDDVVFVALSVETALSNEALQRYTAETGFDWHFAVAPPQMIQSLVESFGQTITNPPSTPHFIIRPDGSTTELTTGIKSADEIVAQLQAAGG